MRRISVTGIRINIGPTRYAFIHPFLIHLRTVMWCTPTIRAASRTPIASGFLVGIPATEDLLVVESADGLSTVSFQVIVGYYD